ncbi:transcription elongation factor a protein [Anaeramoeba flamelloides]|uniref:Transcription elongation factor a protein n=1 Tax=Anaeramoeba flamelloides TaxID=1746091 RepID=A0AAV8A0G8_9EUKA|nr:transcription elongation factor a protein [Anaeramoeba flamelloides]
MEQEIQDIKKQILKITSSELTEQTEEDLINILNNLLEKKITFEILKKTKLGLSINKLRKSTNEKVQKTSLQVFQRLKDIFKEHKKQNSPKQKRKKLPQQKNNTKTDPEGKKKNKKKNSKTTEKKQVKNMPSLGDKVRDNVRKQFFQDLLPFYESVENPPSTIQEIVKEIEQTLYKKFKGTTKLYKKKFRTLSFHFANEKQYQLKLSVIQGKLTPFKLCEMNNKDFMTEDQLQEHEKFIKQGKFRSTGRVIQARESQLKCFRCKQRKCQYVEYQSRSADEPMTVLVSCLNCGNHWKM